MRHTILMSGCLLHLASMAAAQPSASGHLQCNDATPVVACPVTISYRNVLGELDSRTVLTDGAGVFADGASCPFAPGAVGNQLVVTAKCCSQTWTVPNASCTD